MSQLKHREEIHPFSVSLLIGPIEALKGLGDVPSYWQGPFSLSAPTQILIFPGDGNTDTLRYGKVWPGIWASLSPVQWTLKINHHCFCKINIGVCFLIPNSYTFHVYF